MNDIPSLAKLARPQQRDIFPRARLFEKLDAALAKTLTFISAPPGSGKTTLAATYIEERQLPCLWYQVDASDNDPASFFYYLGLGATASFPGDAEPLPNLTPEYTLGLSAFSRGFFRRLYGRAGTPFLMVLDDFQELHHDSRMQALIRDACLETPAGGHWVIISRDEPPAAMVKLRANNELASIDWSDLRLSDEDVKTISETRSHCKGMDIPYRVLNERVGGWAAGLVLFLESGGTGNALHAVEESSFDYFAQEVFSRLDGRRRAFVLKTACLNTMKPELVEQLTAESDAKQLLAQLNRQNIFTTRHGGKQPVYQYHPLFRQFLRTKLAEHLSSTQLETIRKKAAVLSESSGDWRNAIRLYQELDDWNSMARIICHQAPELVSQGRLTTLQQILELLSPDIISNSPWLLFWKGVSRLFINPEEGRIHLEKAYARFEDQSDVHGLLMSWAGITDAIFHTYDNLALLDPWVEALDKIMQRVEMPFPPHIAGRMAVSLFMILAFRQPPHPHLKNWAEQALATSDAVGDIHSSTIARSHCATWYIWTGRMALADLVLNELRNAKSAAPPIAGLVEALVDATYALHSGEHKRCIAAVNRGLELASNTGIVIWNTVFLSEGVLSSLNAQDFGLADTYLENLAKATDSLRNTDKSFYCFLKAWRAQLQGRHAVAIQHGSMALQKVDQCGIPYFISLCQMGMSWILHCNLDFKGAEEHLSQAMRIGEQIKNPFILFNCLLFKAAFAMARDRHPAHVDPIRKALELGKSHHYMHCYLWLPDVITNICLSALRHGIEIEYVGELINHHDLEPGPPMPDNEYWPWPVKIYTLGRFSVVKDGKPVVFTGKSKRRPMDLLKALIAFGATTVNEQRLADVLWPEAEGDTAKQALATTLFRLRKLVGNETILRQEGRLSLNTDSAWLDMRALDHLFSAGTEKSIHSWDSVITLYQGPFLNHDDSSWILPARDKIHNQFIRYVCNSGSRLIDAGQLDQAASLFQQGLEIDNLAEVFYRGLIRTNIALGHRSDAIRTYERCRKALLHEYGIEPSAETKHLVQSIGYVD